MSRICEYAEIANNAGETVCLKTNRDVCNCPDVENCKETKSICQNNYPCSYCDDYKKENCPFEKLLDKLVSDGYVDLSFEEMKGFLGEGVNYIRT